jgi:peptidoglycan-associated lipoprotein
MRLALGIAAFLLWATGSGYWYACKVKGACNDSPAKVVLGEEGTPEEDVGGNGNSGSTASIGALSDNGEGETTASEEGEEAIEETSLESELPEETDEETEERFDGGETVAVATLSEAVPGDLLKKRTVLFSFAKPLMNNRADLNEYLDAASEYLRRNPGAKVRITGYTDDTAARENNLKLGQRRAEAVAELFRERGVSDDQLELISKGEQDPVASNDTREGRQRNRRAELQLIDHSEN